MSVELMTSKYFQDEEPASDTVLEDSLAYRSAERAARRAPSSTWLTFCTVMLVLAGFYGCFQTGTGILNAMVDPTSIKETVRATADPRMQAMALSLVEIHEKTKFAQLFIATVGGVLSVSMLVGAAMYFAGAMRATQVLATCCGWAIAFVIVRFLFQEYVTTQAMNLVSGHLPANAQGIKTIISLAVHAGPIIGATISIALYWFIGAAFRRHADAVNAASNL